MFGAVRRGTRAVLAPAWKLFKWLFLLTLPFTLIPGLCGLIEGVIFSYWINNRFEGNQLAFVRDVKDVADDWGVSGFSFRDFQDTDNDFHTLRINTNDWLEKMGFVVPLELSDQRLVEKSTPIDKHADLTSLMVYTRAPAADPTVSRRNWKCEYRRPPREQWVYISDFGHKWDPWDRAFSAAVEAAYSPHSPSLNASRLFFATCKDTAGFLCDIWEVRAPSLLHFLVEEDGPSLMTQVLPYEYTYQVPPQFLKPVTVRVIELPLEDAYMGRSHSAGSRFPSREEQMLAIMRGGDERLYEQFEPWTMFEQVFRRFYDHLDKLYERKGSFMYYLGEAYSWVDDNITKRAALASVLDANTVRTVYFGLSFPVSGLVITPWCLWVRPLWRDYWGMPGVAEQVASEPKMWNPLDGYMEGMMGMLAAVKNANSQAKLEQEFGEGITETPVGARATGAETTM